MIYCKKPKDTWRLVDYNTIYKPYSSSGIPKYTRSVREALRFPTEFLLRKIDVETTTKDNFPN